MYNIICIFDIILFCLDLLSMLFRTGAGKKSRNDRRYRTYGLNR